LMIAVSTVFSVVMGVIAWYTPIDPQYPNDHPAVLRAWWIGADGEGTVLIGATVLIIGAAICGASVAGAEWRAGTMTTLLTWAPSRWRFHLARTASAAVLSFVIGLAVLAVFCAGAVPSVLAHGTTSGTDAGWWVDLGLVMVRAAGIAALLAVVALSVATIGRNTAAALVVLSAWALFAESLVRGLKPGLSRFLIAENVGIVVPWRSMEDAPFARGPGLALLTLVCYLAGFVAVATWAFQRRDVAAT
jgi:ABC-type transport system involved in multi-copper enzyme maturation permease subunit